MDRCPLTVEMGPVGTHQCCVHVCWLCKSNLYSDNTNTTQTLEFTKDKYNVKIIKQRFSPKVPPTTYKV
jgi:hypothetical protein